MAENFRLDEEAARRAAARLRTAGERLGAAHADLTAVLTDKDGCWGTDDIGKAFSTNYVPIADAVRTNGGTYATNHRDVSEFVDGTVTAFVDTDDANAGRIDRLNAENVESWTA